MCRVYLTLTGQNLPVAGFQGAIKAKSKQSKYAKEHAQNHIALKKRRPRSGSQWPMNRPAQSRRGDRAGRRIARPQWPGIRQGSAANGAACQSSRSSVVKPQRTLCQLSPRSRCGRLHTFCTMRFCRPLPVPSTNTQMPCSASPMPWPSSGTTEQSR